MPVTDEDIAREAVDAIVASTVAWAREEIGAGVSKEQYRAAVLAALREARVPPGEPPVSKERLEDIRERAQRYIDRIEITALLALNDYKDRLISWLVSERLQEGEDARALLAEAERRGYEKGKRAATPG